MKVIFLHIYYSHLYPEILQRLQQIPFEFRLYVNLVNGYSGHLKDDILNHFPTAIITISPNAGMDCGGNLRNFQHWLQHEQNEDFLIFLHSKGKPFGFEDSKKVQETDELRNLLWSIVSPEKYPLVEKAFEDENVGMVGVHEWHRYPGRDHGDPIPECQRICTLLALNNYETNSFGFIGGTMFFVRSKLFKEAFKNIDIEAIVKELPPSSNGGDIHAWERIFGYIPLSLGYQIKGI